ncbi:5125_t:CDS:1 [Paraglomus brasilianum]|uniref:5125_t:CDS:1 n=1 Tax=Paraglomus brasilianum TaxID=144538 RepID=A0A9N9AUX5_9GLOM|nr:5125_t:CDS:1 [Paraglomus brasilianum]
MSTSTMPEHVEIRPDTSSQSSDSLSTSDCLRFSQVVEEVIEEVRRVYPNIHTTLPLKELLDPAEKKRSKGVPRPQNCFMLYRKDIRARFTREGNALSVAESSRIAAESWRNLPQEEKNFWHALYEIVKMQHAIKYPNYKYQPVRGKQAKKGRGMMIVDGIKRSDKDDKSDKNGQMQYQGKFSATEKI